MPMVTRSSAIAASAMPGMDGRVGASGPGAGLCVALNRCVTNCAPASNAGLRLLPRRLAVADGDDDASRNQCADEIERAGQLRGERDHRDARARAPGSRRVEVGGAERRWIVRAVAGWCDERALDVPAERDRAEVAFRRSRAPRGARPGHDLVARADEGRQERGDAEPRQRRTDAPERLGVVGEVVAGGAVDLQVDEPGRHEEPGGIEPASADDVSRSLAALTRASAATPAGGPGTPGLRHRLDRTARPRAPPSNPAGSSTCTRACPPRDRPQGPMASAAPR